MRVGIVGGSIAGCATAALLHRAGHDVIVFERSESDLVSRGAGIGTPTTVWQDMMAHGLIEETLPAFRIDYLRFVTRGSGTGQQRWLGDVQPPLSFTLVNWAHLYQRLRQGVPDDLYRSASTVELVNTRPVSCHSGPADSRASACHLRCSRNAVTAFCGKARVRRDFSVLVSPCNEPTATPRCSAAPASAHPGHRPGRRGPTARPGPPRSGSRWSGRGSRTRRDKDDPWPRRAAQPPQPRSSCPRPAGVAINPDRSTEFGSWFGSVPRPSRSQLASDLWANDRTLLISGYGMFLEG